MFGGLLDRISVHEFYERLLGHILPLKPGDFNIKIPCPFHMTRIGSEDSTNSMSINVERHRGGKYKCFGCGASGNLIKFYQDFIKIQKGESLDIRQTVNGISTLMGIDPATFDDEIIDDTLVSKFKAALHETEAGQRALKYIKAERMLSDAVIGRFNLGFDETTRRVTIPIIDAEGKIVNIRKWLPGYARITELDHANKIISITGRGVSRMFPHSALQEQELIITEGEMDCLALISAEFNAITGTAGANTFNEQWARYFTNKDIVIIYDNDAAGHKGADIVCEKLQRWARTIKIIYLDKETIKMDATDFLRKWGSEGPELLRAKIDNTEPLIIQEETNAKLYAKCNVFSAANSQFVNKLIRLTAVVVGKEETPFIVPKQIQCRCGKPTNHCINCPSQTSKGMKQVTLEPDDRHLIEYARTKERNWHLIHHDVFGVGKVRGCGAEYDVVEGQFYNIEDIRIMPSMDFTVDQDYEWALRQCYYNGHGLKQNTIYDFFGRTCIDPISTQCTHIFDKAEVSNDALKSLDLHSKVVLDGEEATLREHLSIFQPKPGQFAHAKLMEIYGELELYVTRIVNRRDVLQALDLTYHSPIHFHFDSNDLVKKGWIDTLIIGDTHCGKSVSAYKLQEHYRLGAILDGKITSRVGLTGGYVDLTGVKRRFVLGTLPLNDGKYVLIDEGLTPEILSELRMVRSSGMVIANKQAQQNQYPARVRLVIISNPKNGKSMASFNYGIEAVKQLIGDDADISRFDIVVAVGSDEVDISDINTGVRVIGETQYTSDKCNALLKYIWKRKAADWEIQSYARDIILERSTAISKIYDASTIPLISGASVRYKIAKIACAIAARLFNVDDSGQKIIVTPDHVDAALEFMHSTLNKPSLNYHMYSAKQKKLQQLPRLEETIKILSNLPYTVTEFLHDQRQFTKRIFVESVGMPEYEAKAIFNAFIQLRVIEQRGEFCRPTPGFLHLMTTFEHPDTGGMLGKILDGNIS